MKKRVYIKKFMFVCLVITCLCFHTNNIQAQGIAVGKAQNRIYSPFRIGLGLGTSFGETITQALKSSRREAQVEYAGVRGLPLWLEPQYGITDRISVGLRVQAFFLSAEDIKVDGAAYEESGEDDGGLALVGLIALQGDYFFVNSHPWRFSAGLGIGYYRQGSGGTLGLMDESLVSLEEDDVKLDRTSSIGLAPRVRAQIAFVELGLVYHYTFSDEVQSLFAIDLGFVIGGKRYDE